MVWSVLGVCVALCMQGFSGQGSGAWKTGSIVGALCGVHVHLYSMVALCSIGM